MLHSRTAKVAAAMLGAFLVFAPSAGRADEASLYAAAKAEGQVVWYTTLIFDTAVRPLIAAFEQKYPGVEVKFSRADSVPTALKILAEGRAGKPQADVFDGTETAAPLIRAGLVNKYIPPNLDAYPPQVKDPNGYWYAFMYYFLTPAINTKLIPKDQAPKTAQDLLDPKWRGKIAWNMSSSTGAMAFVSGIMMMMGEEKGTAYLEAARQAAYHQRRRHGARHGRQGRRRRISDGARHFQSSYRHGRRQGRPGRLAEARPDRRLALLDRRRQERTSSECGAAVRRFHAVGRRPETARRSSASCRPCRACPPRSRP